MDHKEAVDNLSDFQLLYYYFKKHIKSFLIIALFFSVFIVIMLLYGYPPDGIIYGAFLCLCLSVLFFIPGFLNFRKKHRLLSRLMTLESIEQPMLPAAQQLIEQDYVRLCEMLLQRNSALISEYETGKSDMIDYFTMWVHQIKTPIFAMHLLLSDSISEKDREISHELFKIEQYVNMVLSYLRLDYSPNDFVIKQYSLDDIIRQAIRKFAPQFIRKKLSVDYTPVSVSILTDEKWFLFILEQILSNALKYTQSGKISIYMDNPETLVIEDTGIGISPEDLPRIFEKGYTGYNGRTDKKASGLGLYLCQRTATLLSHTLRIESEPDKGTRVYISFHSQKTLFD